MKEGCIGIQQNSKLQENRYGMGTRTLTIAVLRFYVYESKYEYDEWYLISNN